MKDSIKPLSWNASNTVTLPRREIRKSHDENYETTYTVCERGGTGWWTMVSKPYYHSTSAFAALGRMTDKQSKAEQTAEQTIGAPIEDTLFDSNL